MNDLDQDLNGTPLVPRSYEPQVKDGEMEAKPKAVPGAEPGAVPEAVVDIEAFGEYHIEIRRPMDLEAIQAAAAAAAAAEEKGEGSKRSRNNFWERRDWIHKANRDRVAKKVEWFVALCAERRPKSNDFVSVPAEMTGKKPEEFKAGSFLSCIRKNWKEGGKPSTTLDAKQVAHLQSAQVSRSGPRVAEGVGCEEGTQSSRCMTPAPCLGRYEA